MQRPQNLPEFNQPPLNEVVLGVQFAPPKGYSQVRAGEVWQLFRADYPVVEERDALPQIFETFGLMPPGIPPHQLKFVSGATHDRFWFINPAGDELIQFQQDRLLHNWRKVGDQTNEYPRFESMFDRFRSELLTLQTYFASLAPQSLTINQCEVSYINQIATSDGAMPKPAEWLAFLSLDGHDPEAFSAVFREIIRGSAGHPIGRLTCECASTVSQLGRPIIVLTLTVRGSPSGTTIDEALAFIQHARSTIVEKFALLTTPAAHRAWERQQ